MRFVIASLMLGLSACSAWAVEISSVYTDLDVEKDCTAYAAADEGDGDWANFVCTGYKGYPVIMYTGDLRQSMFYGFPPKGEHAPAWESFGPFNSTGAKVEWRIETDGARAVPFATIHRWFVSDPQEPETQTEVLVVSKVGQVDDHDGCVIGLVLATGNENANEMARKVADETARSFACGADERVIVGSPMPEFSRSEN